MTEGRTTAMHVINALARLVVVMEEPLTTGERREDAALYLEKMMEAWMRDELRVAMGNHEQSVHGLGTP